MGQIFFGLILLGSFVLVLRYAKASPERQLSPAAAELSIWVMMATLVGGIALLVHTAVTFQS